MNNNNRDCCCDWFSGLAKGFLVFFGIGLLFTPLLPALIVAAPFVIVLCCCRSLR